MRRIACFILSLLIITGVPVSACAAQSPGGIETQSLYTAKPTVNISISKAGIATFYLTCRGKSDVTKIKAKTCIEKKSGTRWVKVNVGTSDNYIYHSVNSSKMIHHLLSSSPAPAATAAQQRSLCTQKPQNLSQSPLMPNINNKGEQK